MIELKDICVSSDDVPILDGISTFFPEGKTSIIMGNSGSGKTTLLKTAAFLMPPDSGSIFFEGKDLIRMNDREMLAFRKESSFMFQDSALWANKSIQENLSLPLQFHFPDITEKEIRERIGDALSGIGIKIDLSSRPASHSAGRQRIIAYIRAMISQPRLLFADEPTTFIDRKTSTLLINELKFFQEKGNTVIAVTHDPEILSAMGDYLFIMKDGVLIGSGDTEEILNSEDPVLQSELIDVARSTSRYGKKAVHSAKELLGE